ncbi:MAG TPA: hypothetical protein ENG69_01025 [Candidatus Korarchaeota archaeon]|nr:hypothetical protein [Candidatus Korarchaeota archaeon]
MRWFGIGLGGAGGAIIDKTYVTFSGETPSAMIDAVVFNTSVSDRAKLSVLKDRFYLFGKFGGAGVGARWKDSMKAMMDPESRELFVRAVSERGISESTGVMLSAALGGGTGSGSMPIVAEYVKELLAGPSGELTQPIISVGVLPFKFPKESMRFAYNSAIAIANMLKRVDSLILLDNEIAREIVLRDEPGLTDEQILDRINSLVGKCLVAMSAADVEPLRGGYKTTFDSQDLKSILRFFEASLTVPCYMRARVESVGGSLEFLTEAALREGCLAEVRPGTALKAALVVRGPEEYLNVESVFEAKELLSEKIAGLDIREGLAVAPGSKYFEVAILLVEPELVRLPSLLKEARLYYEVHEEELTKMEDTPREEFEAYIEAVERHLLVSAESREEAATRPKAE